MKKHPARRYAEELYALTKDLGDKEAKSVVGAFVKLLAERHRLRLAPKILEAYSAYAKAKEGWIDATVTTAADVSDKETEALRTALEGATNRKIDLRRATDPSLLGGAVIRYGDTLLDASLKRRLALLKTKLSE